MHKIKWKRAIIKNVSVFVNSLQLFHSRRHAIFFKQRRKNKAVCIGSTVASAFRDNIMISLTRGRFRKMHLLIGESWERQKQVLLPRDAPRARTDGWRKGKDAAAAGLCMMRRAHSQSARPIYQLSISPSLSMVSASLSTLDGPYATSAIEPCQG